MKFSARFILVVVLGIFMLTETQCNKTPASSGITSYSYLKPIVNPPDTFQVAYDLSVTGNLIAHITFQDSAVWKIRVLTPSDINYGFVNPANDSMVYITSSDTVGLRGGIKYSFIANNVNNDSLNENLYYVKFTKLPIDYHTFPKKY